MPNSILWARWLPKIGWGFLLLVVLAAIYWILTHKKPDQPQQKKMVQQITVISAPPPPPPPPPPEEKLPEPEPEEVLEEKLDEPDPEPQAADTPAQDLGIEGEGGAGSDGFGLVARKGGTGLLGSANYGAYMKNELQKLLMQDKKLRSLEYRALVKVWLDNQGHIDRTQVEVLQGETAVKTLLETFLVQFPTKIKVKPLESPDDYYELRISSVY